MKNNASKAKLRNKIKSEEKQITRLRRKIKKINVTSTPFASVGRTLGSAVGGLFGGGETGGRIGKWLGSSIGSIFGSGDYITSGSPTYNILSNDAVPQFSTGKFQNMVCHREYIGDVVGSTGFNNNVYPINPGIGSTFPWLNTIAAQYEEYKLHGMVVEFKTTSSDYNAASPALGVVMLATQYNVNSPAFITKIAMENYEYAVSVKPSQSVLHAIECKQSLTPDYEKYVRTGDVADQDLRLYDFGTLNVATQGMSSAYTVGELWISYCVELIKPKITGVALPTTAHICRTGVVAGTPMGTTTVKQSGNLLPTLTATTFTFDALKDFKYLCVLTYYNATAFAVPTAVPTFTATSASGKTTTLASYWVNDTVATLATQNAVSASTQNTYSVEFIVSIPTNLSKDSIIITVGSSNIPTSTLDLWISMLDHTILS